MNNKIKKKFIGKRYTLILFAFIVLAIFMFLLNRSEKYNVQRIYGESIHARREFLHDTVENLVLDINFTKDSSIEMYETMLDSDFPIVKKNIGQRGLSYLREYVGTHNMGNSITMHCGYVAYNSRDYDVIEDTLSLLPFNWDGDESVFDQAFVAYRKVEFSGTTYVYGYLRVGMEESLERIYRDKIHGMKFSSPETNLVIRKILNYSGGSNYAACLVNMNEASKEGSYYSTESENESFRPFADELERLVHGGRSYLIQRIPGNDKEQLVGFSMLEKSLNWVITMVTVSELIDEITPVMIGEEKVEISSLAVVPVGIVLMLLLILALFYCIIADQKRYNRNQRKLKEQVDFDALTKANSRQFGKEDLAFAWRRFLTNPKNAPAIMFMDLDKFKHINDFYGHEAGDLVLQGVVKKIYDTIRHSDVLIRWGGDEFLGIFQGLEKADVARFAKKLLEAIENLKIEYQGKVLQVTASLGFSFFLESDNDEEDVVKRADNGLYECKGAGGNTFFIV